MELRELLKNISLRSSIRYLLSERRQHIRVMADHFPFAAFALKPDSLHANRSRDHYARHPHSFVVH